MDLICVLIINGVVMKLLGVNSGITWICSDEPEPGLLLGGGELPPEPARVAGSVVNTISAKKHGSVAVPVPKAARKGAVITRSPLVVKVAGEPTGLWRMPPLIVKDSPSTRFSVTEKVPSVLIMSGVVGVSLAVFWTPGRVTLRVPSVFVIRLPPANAALTVEAGTTCSEPSCNRIGD